MTDAVDYQSVIADLKARRAALDQVIASLEAVILGQGDPAAVKADPVGPGATMPLGAIHPDTFYGLSMIEAAKKFLGIARRAQHTGAIADALARGGLKRPDVNSLSSILVRAAKGREVTKVGKGMWGLAAWYPKAPKEPEERTRAPRGRPRKKVADKPSAKKAGAKAPTPAPQVDQEKAAHKNGAGSMDIALEVLREAAGKPLRVAEILKRAHERGLLVHRLPLGGFLGRQAKAGKIQKMGPGMYAA